MYVFDKLSCKKFFTSFTVNQLFSLTYNPHLIRIDRFQGRRCAIHSTLYIVMMKFAKWMNNVYSFILCQRRQTELTPVWFNIRQIEKVNLFSKNKLYVNTFLLMSFRTVRKCVIYSTFRPFFIVRIITFILE